MVTRALAFTAALLVAGHASAAAPARSMYGSARAREAAIRPALSSDTASLETLKEVRAVVAAYRAIVRRYPASGYSDNALWQAGRLALDAFARFGQWQDRETGVRLLRNLATAYPTSKLAREVPDQLARIQAAADAPRQPRAPAVRDGSGPDRNGPGRNGPDRTAGPAERSQPRGEPALPARAGLALIRDIRRVVLPDVVRVTIELDGEVAFRDERIADPSRVFVDLPFTRAAGPLVDRTLRFDGDADVVHQVRIGRHPHDMTRVVLDAAGVSSYSVYPLYDPYRLVIDCVRPAPPVIGVIGGIGGTGGSGVIGVIGVTGVTDVRNNPQSFPPARRTLDARRLASDWGRRLPAMSARRGSLIRDVRAELATVASVEATSPPPVIGVSGVPGVLPRPGASPPASPAGPVSLPPPHVAGGFSIARQLGLGVSRIVIDPGHGGHDPGAKGKGITEAELVLDVALRLEKLLAAVPGIEVILTRRTDDFVALQERTAIANREGADVFLSIHANASASAQARGVETYFLNFANNLSAAGVAARENAASGQAMGALPDFVKAIALNNKLDESRDFATQVQRAMIEKLRGQNKVIRDLGVKQAPFIVLIGAAMPSVLAEISFVTNAQEAKLLKANAYRQKIAEALYGAVRKYQTSLGRVTAVAHQ
jgi:N-acetylmuramoyl-L-alanine amidase